LHPPIKETYGASHHVSNVVLVVDSGFRNSEGSQQYLTGEWSVARGYLHMMPADSIRRART
jgi:enoyl reductase-like protein